MNDIIRLIIIFKWLTSISKCRIPILLMTSYPKNTTRLAMKDCSSVVALSPAVLKFGVHVSAVAARVPSIR